MLVFRLHRRLIAWMTAWVMLAGALMPTMAQAMWLGQPDRAQWIEVCSASGMMWVRADATDGEQEPVSDPEAGTSCPWCMLHGGSPGLAPAEALDAVPTPRLTDLPPAFYQAPHPLAVWAHAPSRAPPSA